MVNRTIPLPKKYFARLIPAPAEAPPAGAAAGRGASGGEDGVLTIAMECAYAP